MAKKVKRAAAALWEHVAPAELANQISAILPHTPEAADAIALALLTAKISEWLELSARVKASGLTEYSGRSGISHLSPDARREAEVFDEVLKLCREFGLTPLSRSRLEAKVKSVASAPPQFAGFISSDPGKPLKR